MCVHSARDAEGRTFSMKCMAISEMAPPATTTLAPESAMPLIASSIIFSSPLL